MPGAHLETKNDRFRLAWYAGIAWLLQRHRTSTWLGIKLSHPKDNVYKEKLRSTRGGKFPALRENIKGLMEATDLPSLKILVRACILCVHTMLLKHSRCRTCPLRITLTVRAAAELTSPSIDMIKQQCMGWAWLIKYYSILTIASMVEY